MILHLLTDEKFSDYVVEQFSAKEMCSDFVLVSNANRMVHFHYIEKVRIINSAKQEDLEVLLNLIPQYNGVVFHGLFEPWQEWLLRRCSSSVKLAWSVWGGEIYGREDLINSFLLPITKTIVRSRQLIRRIDTKQYVVPNELFRRINYCMTNVNEEYVFCRNYLQADFKHLPYTYYALSDMIGPLMNATREGNNIWIGNSATIENNHFDTLFTIKKLGIGDRKLIVPLSYGEPWERNACIRFGCFLFGERFTPLVDFMPREEYNRTMLSCSVMIQPHLREQAHGNIVTGLWLGMRVYLSERGMEYNHFKRIGCKVFSIEKELRRSNPNALLPLTEDEVKQNRDALAMAYGREHVDEINSVIVRELA